MNLADAANKQISNRSGKNSDYQNQSVRMPTGRSIQSVDRALTLLEVIAEEREGLTLSVIAERAGLNPSTCHHLLSTLVQRGYLTHLSRTHGYALGMKIREINDSAERALEPSVLLRKDVKALGARLGYGIQLAVLSNTSLMTKLSFAGTKQPVVEPDELEKMTAMHATATGKAILAWVPDTELVRVISANGLNAYTSKTITSLSGVVEELRWVRRQKFAVDDEEFREGIVCIGSSIRKKGGEVVAAISVTMSAEQATEETRALITREMIVAGNQFSSKLRNDAV